MNFRSFFRGGPTPGQGEGAPRRKPARKRFVNLRCESLEPRTMLSGTTIPINFSNIPADIQALGVWIEASGTLTAPYVASYGTVAAGTVVYYNSTLQEYAPAQTSSPLVYQLPLGNPVLNLPNTPIKSGQIVIGIGSAPVVTYSSGGIAAPTASTNPNHIFGLFEFTIDGHGLDVDMSEIDQVGFPFTITSTPDAPDPANDGVGMSTTRNDMFSLYVNYINTTPNASLFMQSFTQGNGYRILAPQNVIDGAQAPTLGAPTYSTPGNLAFKQTYYYWVTATNLNGETGASNVAVAVPGTSIQGRNVKQGVVLSWAPFQQATGYNVYRSLANNSALATKIGSALPGKTTFTDPGLGNGSGHPPSNSYTYWALNAYFDGAINNFFSHYTTTGSFTINRDGYTFTGQVNTNYIFNGQIYTVLELSTTAQALSGQVFRIFRPYFSNNTNISGAPLAPNWMKNTSQSPAAMILACDGVFNTGGEQPGVDAKTLSDLENSIVSAFNRGIANNFNIAPNNWAAAPALYVANPTAGGNLEPGTNYYYVITGTNASGDTTASIERAALTNTNQKSVTLAWTPDNISTQFNIYRSKVQGSGYELIQSIPATASNPNIFVDTGYARQAGMTPFVYYATGTAANWYSAFLHQNSTNNPTNGVSINGLAYGFAYDDQGNNSTNFQGFFSSIDVNIQALGVGSQFVGSHISTTSDAPAPTVDGPALLQILTQPSSGRLDAVTDLVFQVLDAQGRPYLGTTSVTVQLVGPQQGTYAVTPDATTGIGRLSFVNTTLGTEVAVIKLPGVGSVTSKAFQILPRSTSDQLLALYNLGDGPLSPSDYRQAFGILTAGH